jgi:hypothetical protein
VNYLDLVLVIPMVIPMDQMMGIVKATQRVTDLVGLKEIMLDY